MALSLQSAMRKFSRSLGANILNVMLTTITGIIIPRMMGATQYGYWELLILYITYIPYFHLGHVDGIYLQEGGKSYDELDGKAMHTQFWLSFGYDIIVAVAFFCVSLKMSGGESVVMKFVAIECIIFMPRVFCQYLLQATGRVEEYAKNVIQERLVCASLQMILIILGHCSLYDMLFCELMGKAFSLVMIVYYCRSFIFSSGVSLASGLTTMGKDIKIGFKLTFSTVSGMLLIGIIQFAVEGQWSIEEFGMISFALVAVESTVMFINQISVVLFPLLKQSKREEYHDIYVRAGSIITLMATVVLMLFHPLILLMQLILPSYVDALHYLSLMGILCLFETRTSLLSNTFLKTIRKENQMLIINIVMMALAVVAMVVTVFVLHDLTAVVLSIDLLLVFRCLCTDLVLQRDLGFRAWGEFLFDLLVAVAFLLTEHVVQGMLGYGIFVAFAVVSSLCRKNTYAKTFELFKKTSA